MVTRQSAIIISVRGFLASYLGPSEREGSVNNACACTGISIATGHGECPLVHVVQGDTE